MNDTVVEWRINRTDTQGKGIAVGNQKTLFYEKTWITVQKQVQSKHFHFPDRAD
jgi:hypothetical protein